MTDVYDDDYWSSQFSVTQDDLKRIVERMERESAPQEFKEIATRIVRGRLEHGHDLSPAALTSLTGKASVRLWDPAAKWQIGDVVLVARRSGNDRDGNPLFSAYIGEVWDIDSKVASIRIEKVGQIKYGLAKPGSKHAIDWHETVRNSVERKLQSGNLDQQAEGILLKHGENILSHLAETLQSDSRFIDFEGKWYVAKKLPMLDDDTLRRTHRLLLEKPSATIDDLVPAIKTEDSVDDTLLRMSLDAALRKLPSRFKNTGTSTRPQWQAQIPPPEKAVVTHFAYDPKTYLILCRPGQHLTQKQAERLQELNLYTSIVTFAE